MKNIFSYPNFLYGGSIVLACVLIAVSNNTENAYKSSRILANLSVFFLYISLLASALNANIKIYPGKLWLVKYRKAHGITAFLLAAGHSFVAFVHLVGGVTGFLESYLQYQLFLAAGIVANDIFILMFLTSNSFAMRKMKIWWKRLHRFVYLAGTLIVAHAVMMRVYFGTITDVVSIVSLFFFVVLVVLQLLRFYKYLNRKN